MSDTDQLQRRLDRNVRLYPLYVATFNGFGWMPVFFLYFSQHLTLANVLRLEAVYYAAVVLLEIPSGYFSDRVGRRPTLMISALAFIAAYVLFMFDGGFAVFAIAQILLATGIAFNSGTDTSFLYDSLAATRRTDEYPAIEAVATRNGMAASAIAAITGGLVAMIDLRLAYAVSLVAALMSLAIVIAFREPPVMEKEQPLGAGFVSQLVRCVGLLRNRMLAWIFAFSVLMTVLNHVPYEFYQPYLDLLRASIDLPDGGTPIAAAVHMALAMLLGSWAAAHSIRIRDRLGIGRTLLLAGLFQTIVIATMGWALHIAIAVLAFARSVPRGLMSPPINAAVTPRVPKSQRATYLSRVLGS